MAPRRRVLLISNGHGEDSIGAAIARRLSDFEVDAYPMLGDGRSYADACPIVGPRRYLPSQGHRRKGSLWADTLAGFGIGPAVRFMRTEGSDYDAIVVVGDMIGVALCWWNDVRVRLYLDVYKSGFANSYSALERWIIRRTCGLVLTRDRILAEQLSRARINARFAGNVMMDTIPNAAYDAQGLRRHRRAIAILPGSRTDASSNFALQIAALRQVPGIADVDLFAALAPGTDIGELASASQLAAAPDVLAGDLNIHISSNALASVFAASDIVLGQAGTANLQALGLGRPVVSFQVDHAREARRNRIAALTGDSRIVTERRPEALAVAITALLADDADRLRRGAIGKERIGPPGAIEAVLAELARDEGS